MRSTVLGEYSDEPAAGERPPVWTAGEEHDATPMLAVRLVKGGRARYVDPRDRDLAQACARATLTGDWSLARALASARRDSPAAVE